jgi:TPP-dependent pyruvate/acetoin dehydrogenase alpha subunit
MDNQALYERLFYQALLIRRVEEKIIDIYPSDQIQSPVHLSIGQEAVSVGLCAVLRPSDIIYGSYRSHALYIACGGDLIKMFAELMGRVGGISKGKAGSMHLSYPEKGLMGASAVVASHIPHAVGSALAAKHRRTGQVVACVFGDGALEEGVSHESLNFAALRALPVLFLCENNGLAVHSHLRDRQAFTIEGMARLYGIPYTKLAEGWDLEKVHEVCTTAVAAVRDQGKAQFLEISTFRSKEHVGVGDDLDQGYRARAEFARWQARDPLVQDSALANSFLPEIDSAIEAALTAARASPAPGIEHLLTDVA